LFFVEQKNSFSEELSKKNNLEVIEKKIKTIQANISEIETELLKTNSQNITAKQQLYKIRKLIALQKEEIFYSEKKINELSRSLKALEAEKQKIIDLLNYRKKRLYRRLVDLATLLQESPFDVAWVQSYEDIIIREAVFQSLTEKDIKLVQELKQNTDEALALELRLIEEKNQIEYYIQELKSQSSLLAANEEIQKEIIKTNRVARLENLKSIQELKKAEKELTMVFNQVQSTSSSAKYGFALLKGKLQSPIEGKIKNKYGRFYDQKTNLFTFNKGITIEAQKNSPVKAVAEGRVVFSGPLKHYGLIVILEHAGQYYTLYGQLSQVLVKENDFVKMSTVIGLSSDEPVYFEIRNKNIAVNPMEWLKEKS
jgi:murein DD-endopeptidase MepM/ murein hydrolase activator NlpD